MAIQAGTISVIRLTAFNPSWKFLNINSYSNQSGVLASMSERYGRGAWHIRLTPYLIITRSYGAECHFLEEIPRCAGRFSHHSSDSFYCLLGAGVYARTPALLYLFHFFPRVRMAVISASGVPCAGGCAQMDCVSMASQPSGMTYILIPIRAFK